MFLFLPSFAEDSWIRDCWDEAEVCHGISVLLLSDSLANTPESVCADGANCDKVGGRAEATSGQVATVLHGLVAAGWRHVLRHGCGGVCVRLSGEVWAGQLGARDVVVVKAAGLLGWPSEVQPMEAAESVRSVGSTSTLR